MKGRSPSRALAGIAIGITVAAVATVAPAVAGPPPNLVDMHPHGGQQGKALRLVIEGYGIAGDLKIESTLPGSFARLGDAADEDRPQKQRRPNDRNLQAAVFLVEIDADAVPGLYPLRTVSEDGLSNALLFRVDTVPEVSEQGLREAGPDGFEERKLLHPTGASEAERALPHREDGTVTEATLPLLHEGRRVPRIAALPVVVNGTLDGAERDRYRFQATRGERIVLEVEARRVGSAVDPVLRLLDRDGRELAANQEGAGIDVDARLDWQPPDDGEYVVEVHDARFSDQRRNFYRLKLIAASDYEYAEAVFPLGGRRGEQKRFAFTGGSSADARDVVRVVETENAFDLVGPADAGRTSAALPFQVVVGSHPELLESELESETAGQPQLTGTGREHARRDASAEPAHVDAQEDPAVRDRDRVRRDADRNEGRRPHRRHDLDPPIVVNGRIDEAGEVDRYRIAAEPGRKLLIEVEGAALGASDLFGVLTVTTPDGEYLASSGDDIPDPDTFRLLSPTATSFDPWVLVEPPEGVDELHVTVEDLVGRGGPRFGYRLTANAHGPDFELRLGSAELTLDRGASKPIEIRAVRRGYLGPIRLYVKDPPAGVEAREGWISREVRDNDRRSLARSGRILVTADLDAQRQRFDLEIWGEAVLDDGTAIRRRATVPGSVTEIRAGDGRSYTTEAERSFNAPWLETRLPVLLTGRPGPRLVGLAPETVRLVKGMPFDFEWKYEAPPGEEIATKPPMVVTALIGVGVGEFRVETTDKADYNKSEGSKLIRSSDGTQHDRYTVTLTGEVTVGGRPERLYTPGVTLEIVPGYRIEVSKASVRPGREGAVEGILRREESFRQPVELRADALPTGIVCDSTEVEPEDDGRFRLACEASDAVEAGEYDFLITSSSWLAGEREVRAAYTTVPVTARMEVKGR